MSALNRIDSLNNPSIPFRLKFESKSNHAIMKLYKGATIWNLNQNELRKFTAYRAIPKDPKKLKSWLASHSFIPILREGKPCIISKAHCSPLFLELLSRMPYENCVNWEKNTIVTCQYSDGYHVFLRDGSGKINVNIYAESGIVNSFPVNISDNSFLWPFSLSSSSEETLKAIVYFQDWLVPNRKNGMVSFEPIIRQEGIKLSFSESLIDLSERTFSLVGNIKSSLTHNTKKSLGLLEDYLNYVYLKEQISLKSWENDQYLAKILLNKICHLIKSKAHPVIVISLMERYEDLVEKLYLAPYLSSDQKIKSPLKEEFWGFQMKNIKKISESVEKCCVNQLEYYSLIDIRIKQLICFVDNIINSDDEYIYSKIKKNLGKGFGYIESLGFMAKVSEYLLNLPRAIYYCNHGIRECAEACSDPEKEQCRQYWLEKFHLILGDIFFRVGDYKQAILVYEKALADVSIQKGNFKLQFFGALARSYIQTQELSKAEDLLNKLRDEPLKAAGYYIAAGHLETARGNYKKAIEHYEVSIKKSSEDDLHLNIIAETSQASVYRMIFHFDKAIALSKECLSKVESLPTHLRFYLEESIYNELGLIYLHKYNLGDIDDIDSAEINFRKAEHISNRYSLKEARGRVSVNLAEVYIEKKDFELAKRYCLIAKNIGEEIGDKNKQGVVYSALGRLYVAQDNLQEAFSHFNSRKLIAEQTGNKHSIALSWHNMGSVLLQEGKLEKAKECFQKAIDIYSFLQKELKDNDQWKITTFEGQLRTYLCLANVLIKQGKVEEALSMLDHGRSRALVDLLSHKLSYDSPPTEPLSKEKILSIAEKHNATLVIYSCTPFKKNAINAWVVDPFAKKITFQECVAPELSLVKHSDPLGMLANPYIVSQESSSLFTSSSEKFPLKGFDLFEEIDNLDSTEEFDPSLEEQKKQTILAECRKWYEILIKPLEDKHLLPGIGSRVAFITDNYLHQLPFAILQGEEGTFLLEKYTPFSIPSILTLELLDQLNDKQKQNRFNFEKIPLVVGDPQQNLENTVAEVEEVGDIFNVEPLIKQEATIQNISERLESAPMLYFSCHGIQGLESKRNIHSVYEGALGLAYETEKKEGYLYAEDLKDVHLNAELALLSACESGRGKIQREGVIGLTRSLLGAGVASVIATHWKINASPLTKQITIDCLKHLLGLSPLTQASGRALDKAEALREAMLAALQDHRDDPRRWGAFFLHGLAIGDLREIHQLSQKY